MDLTFIPYFLCRYPSLSESITGCCKEHLLVQRHQCPTLCGENLSHPPRSIRNTHLLKRAMKIHLPYLCIFHRLYEVRWSLYELLSPLSEKKSRFPIMTSVLVHLRLHFAHSLQDRSSWRVSQMALHTPTLLVGCAGPEPDGSTACLEVMLLTFLLSRLVQQSIIFLVLNFFSV